MNIANKIYDGFDSAADSLGTNRALSWLRTTCDRLSVRSFSCVGFIMYYFSDGSSLRVSYSDARVSLVTENI